MIISLLISIVSTCIILFYIIFVSGGSVFMFNPVLWLSLILIIAIVLWATGYIKDFGLVFTTKKYLKKQGLTKLQNTSESILLAIQTVLTISVAISIASFTFILFNIEDTNRLGPKFATLLDALCCGLTISIILVPLQCKIKQYIFAYMKESENWNTSHKDCLTTIHNPKLHSIIKLLCFIILLCLFIFTFSKLFFTDGNSVPHFFDITSIVIILMFFLQGLFVSGSFTKISSLISESFKEDILTTNKQSYATIIDCLSKSILYGGIFATVMELISTLCYLENQNALINNLYVSCLPLIYALIFFFFITIFKFVIIRKKTTSPDISYKS